MLTVVVNDEVWDRGEDGGKFTVCATCFYYLHDTLLGGKRIGGYAIDVKPSFCFNRLISSISRVNKVLTSSQP